MTETCLEAATFRILVVDDFQPWRHAIRSTLQDYPDFRIVGEAANGIEALHQAQELKPDLILLDISLPVLNGIEVGRRMHEVVPDAKIIFVTSNVDKDVADAALTNGAYGYILKADGKSELLRAINAVIQGEKVVSKRLQR